MSKVGGYLVMVLGAPILVLGIKTAIEHWSVVWRWWFAGGVAVPGELLAPVVLICIGGGLVGGGWQIAHDDL